jgi:hypothetical protein
MRVGFGKVSWIREERIGFGKDELDSKWIEFEKSELDSGKANWIRERRIGFEKGRLESELDSENASWIRKR